MPCRDALIPAKAECGLVHVRVYPIETIILKFIEWRYGLKPLAERDAEANNLLAAFDFDQQGSKDPGGLKTVLLVATIVGLAVIAAAGILLWRRA
jgi:hypothetical protein